MAWCPLLRLLPLLYIPPMARPAAPGVLKVRIRLALLPLAMPRLPIAMMLLVFMATATGSTTRHLLGVVALLS